MLAPAYTLCAPNSLASGVGALGFETRHTRRKGAKVRLLRQLLYGSILASVCLKIELFCCRSTQSGQSGRLRIASSLFQPLEAGKHTGNAE